jgi:hypothetical protein
MTDVQASRPQECARSVPLWCHMLLSSRRHFWKPELAGLRLPKAYAGLSGEWGRAMGGIPCPDGRQARWRECHTARLPSERTCRTRGFSVMGVPRVEGQAQHGGQPNIGPSSSHPHPNDPLTMVGTDNAIAAPRNPTQRESAIQQFANSRSSPVQLREQAVPLLNSKELPHDVQRLTPEARMKFVDKVDQVCRDGSPFFLDLPSIVFTKAYPTVDPQNTTFITALGAVCSAILQLPTSATLPARFEELSDAPTGSGGLADIWRGKSRGGQVAIKAFRLYKHSEKVKEVRIQSAPEVCSRTKFTDSVETGAHVEETTPRKYPTVSRRRHDTQSTGPRLRLGGIWQYPQLRGVKYRCVSSISGVKALRYR